MMQFFSSFSASFLIALLLWPFVAALLTIPVLVRQYRKFNRIHWSRIIAVYLFMLYGLGLLSFTLYPMPDNPVEFCRDYQLSPQMIPFTFITDIASDGLRAILQVVMNIAFFIPLGIFARLLFRWKFVPVLIVGLLASLTIETAQLTGAFGFYPCSYRLFDVDDLILNTSGAILGYAAAMLVPRRELIYAQADDVVTEAGALRRLVAFIIDNITFYAVAALAVIPLYLVDKQLALNLQPLIIVVSLMIFHFAVPFLGKGQTIGGRFTRMSLDDQPRTTFHRLAYYLLRLIWIGAFLLTTEMIPVIIGIITAIIWFIKKRLPYNIL